MWIWMDMGSLHQILPCLFHMATLREQRQVKSLVSSATALTTHCLIPGMTFTALTVAWPGELNGEMLDLLMLDEV